MGSLFLLLFIGFVLLLLLYIVIIVPWWAKPLIIIGAFLAVTADGYLGRKKLEQLCEEQGGLHIYQTVDNVEGVNLGKWMPTESFIKENKYSFIEGLMSLEKVDRLSIDAFGNIIKEKNVKPKSKYTIKSTIQSQQKYYSVYIVQLYDEENKILAETKNFSYQGGWVKRFIAGLYASQSKDGFCPEIRYYRSSYWEDNIFPKILKPKKQEK